MGVVIYEFERLFLPLVRRWLGCTCNILCAYNTLHRIYTIIYSISCIHVIILARHRTAQYTYYIHSHTPCSCILLPAYTYVYNNTVAYTCVLLICTCGRPRGNEISKMASHDPTTVIYRGTYLYTPQHTRPKTQTHHTPLQVYIVVVLACA